MNHHSRRGEPILAPTYLDDVTSGPHMVDARVRLSNAEVIERFLGFHRDRWRPNTLRLRRIQLTAYARRMEPVPIAEATELEVLRYYDGLAHLSPEGRNSQASMLRSFYRWCQTMSRPQVRTDDPTVLLSRPKIPRTLPRPVLQRDYQLALACATNRPELYAWLALMGCGGLRCCEVAWLRTLDVEERPDGTGLLYITGKGGHQRTVPVGTDLMIVLSGFLRGPRGPLFPRGLDGGHHSPDRVSQIINRFLAEIGVRATAHQLRHRFGTSYHEIDADVFRQADVMGHASVDMTRKYTAVSGTEVSRHIERLTRAQLGESISRVAVRPANPARGAGARAGRAR